MKAGDSMAWTSEYFKQDDNIFYGYPIPLNTLAPEIIDKSQLPTKWIFDNAFYGYPHVIPPADISSGNKLVLILGTTPVQKAYLGIKLVWEKDRNINDIIPGIEAN